MSEDTQTIDGDGSGESLPEFKETEYDEFKHYETTKDIIDLRSEIKTPEELLKEEETLEEPKDMLLTDMTVDQLRRAVVNLLSENKMLKETVVKFQDSANRIQKIWNSKEHVKKRYFMLRDNPKAKGVKVVNSR